MSKDEKRFIWLSWRILECKMSYYSQHLIHESWKALLLVSDLKYDALEMEYLKLSEKLNKEPSAANMVGFGDRPCCSMMIEKYSKKRTKYANPTTL